jgi:hypothetical protein
LSFSNPWWRILITMNHYKFTIERDEEVLNIRWLKKFK